ncbi:hypothetical protein Fmac_032686 [Flemingia macrophylla]|uniref:DUF632 domain-containing protein n=1 Tax=Flemingia macrophylla TaxID=520843 RepID=A0ABD1L5L4_9FABA
MNRICDFDFAETVYQSSSILSNLSSSWTSKPPLAVKYRLDASSLEEPSGSKSLCSTLERLLAWEKKLYDEVKLRRISKSLDYAEQILSACLDAFGSET